MTKYTDTVDKYRTMLEQVREILGEGVCEDPCAGLCVPLGDLRVLLDGPRAVADALSEGGDNE